MTRETLAAIALCLITAMAMVWMRDSQRPDEVVVTTTTVVQSRAPMPMPEATPVAKANYVGNINTKKFHKLSCRYATCRNCTAKFATPEEALQARFDRCGICDP